MMGPKLKRALQARVPIWRWLPLYKTEDALGDLVAGLTVGLTLIPQAIAYAGLAEMAPQFGLYSALIGNFVYILFGTCKEVSIGPTALLSLLTFTYAMGSPKYAALLCFLSGCVTMLLGILRLGFLVEFVSVPVVSGFTSAASLIIACSQIKGLLGIKVHGHGFLDTWNELAANIYETKIPDVILSCCCITVLIVLRQIKDMKVSNSSLKKLLWFIGTGRNALVVVFCAVASYIFEVYDHAPFDLTGQIVTGLPSFIPPISVMDFENGAEMFLDMCKHLGVGILTVPLISIIGNVAIAKAFARGRTLDATQEMLTLGLCNVIGSFFQSMPVTGSFSRSAVNNASGVRTPLGGLYTGIIVILSLSLLTPYFYYIPRATLSSVIISAVIFMVEIKMIRPIWKCSKRDLVPAIVTFLACLFLDINLGILVGVTIDLIILVYFNARPTIYIEYRNTSAATYVLVRPSAGLLFPSLDYLRTHLTESLIGTDKKTLKNSVTYSTVVFDCTHVDKIDFTVAQGLATVVKDFHNNKQIFIMLRPTREILQSIKSLLSEEILTAESDVELMTILKESNMENRENQDVNIEMNDVPNGKESTGGELTSTKL